MTNLAENKMRKDKVKRRMVRHSLPAIWQNQFTDKGYNLREVPRDINQLGALPSEQDLISAGVIISEGKGG